MTGVNITPDGTTDTLCPAVLARSVQHESKHKEISANPNTGTFDKREALQPFKSVNIRKERWAPDKGLAWILGGAEESWFKDGTETIGNI